MSQPNMFSVLDCVVFSGSSCGLMIHDHTGRKTMWSINISKSGIVFSGPPIPETGPEIR